MRKTSLAQHVLFSSQLFFIFIALLTLDLLYRWESMLNNLKSGEIVNTIFFLIIIFFVAAYIISLPFWVGIALFRKVKQCWREGFRMFAHFLLIFFFTAINFHYLHLWAARIISAYDITKNGRLLVLTALVIMSVGFFLLHYFVFRKQVDEKDRLRLVAILIFAFAIMMTIAMLAHIVIENHLQLGILFRKYGFLAGIGYYLLYRKQISIILGLRRLFVVRATFILFIFSLIFVGYALVKSKPLPELEVNVAQSIDNNSMRKDVQNIIMITFDALAANRMSLYGNQRETTPTLDALAKTSYVFENMHSEADETVEGITALQTGMHYYGNRLNEYGTSVAGGNVVGYMPRVFDALGWESAYLLYSPNLHLGMEDIFTFVAPYDDSKQFTSTKFHEWLYALTLKNTVISPAWLLMLYNDYLVKYISFYRGIFPTKEGPNLTIAKIDLPGGDKYGRAQEYLLKDKPEHFFLWMHQYPPHQPYYRIDPYKGRFLNDPRTYDQVLADGSFGWNGPPLDPKYEDSAETLKLMYEEYLLATDAGFGQFLDYLKASGLFDNSMIIISADHGEAFEKGDMYSLGRVMYEQTLRIPLIIHMPGQTKGERVQSLAQSVDIMPTILDTLGVSVPNWMEGESLWPYIEKKELENRRITFSQTIPSGLELVENDTIKDLHAFVVYKDDYKLIYRFYANRFLEEIKPPEGAQQRFLERYPQIELFNLKDDPREDNNLAGKEMTAQNELMKLLREQIVKVRRLRVFSFKN